MLPPFLRHLLDSKDHLVSERREKFSILSLEKSNLKFVKDNYFQIKEAEGVLLIILYF